MKYDYDWVYSIGMMILLTTVFAVGYFIGLAQ